MRALMKVGFSLLMLAFVLIGMSYSMLRAQGVSGPTNPEGRTVSSQHRPVASGVAAVDMAGPINMTLRQGQSPSMTVRGEKRFLDKIETSMEGNVLHIAVNGMLLNPRSPLEVELVLPAIERLTITGSGESTVNGFSGDKLQVEMHGSGNVIFNGRYRDINAGVNGTGEMEINGGNAEKVSVELVGSGQMTVVGSCKEFKSRQTGSGDLNAQHLAAEQANVDLNGSGTSTVSARKTAALVLRGSGDINVYGNPSERNITRTGSGEVMFKQ